MVRRSDTQWFHGDDRFIELMDALTHPDGRWAEPDRPDVLLALDELIAWTRDNRDYDERVHEPGWQSAIHDFLIAADFLGSKTKRVVQSHLDVMRNACQPGVLGTQTLREQLSAEAAAMRQTLGTTPALIAAWTDLIGILGRKEALMNTVSVRRDNFWAIVRAVDRNAFELSRRLTSVLTGDPFEVLKAQLALGEIDRIDGDILSIRRSTPRIDPKRRLDLALRLLSLEPISSAHLVWFAFKGAGLTGMVQGSDSIRLFEAQWLRANLLQGGPFISEIPNEIRDLEVANTIPDKSDVVLASVDLGTGTFSDAVREASERLDAFVGMSMLGSPILWERIRGFIHLQDGRIAANQFFRYEDERSESQSPYALEYAAARITDRASRIASRIPVSDRNIKDIIDALHWWRPDPSQPTSASIILNVRIIELIASRAGEKSWTTYLEKYFKNVWIHAVVMDTFHGALHEALHRRVVPEVQSKQREILLEVVEYRVGGQRFHIDKAVRHLDDIIHFTSPDLSIGRDLRTVRQRTSSADALTRWCTEVISAK